MCVTINHTINDTIHQCITIYDTLNNTPVYHYIRYT